MNSIKKKVYGQWFIYMNDQWEKIKCKRKIRENEKEVGGNIMREGSDPIIEKYMIIFFCYF